MIANKLFILLQICVGIWTKEACDAYKIFGEAGEADRYSLYYKRCMTSSSLSDKYKRCLDFELLVRSIVYSRSVLLQLVPQLTFVSSFAYFVSNAPVCIFSEELKEHMPPLVFAEMDIFSQKSTNSDRAFDVAKAQEDDNSWQGTFDELVDAGIEQRLMDMKKEIQEKKEEAIRALDAAQGELIIEKKAKATLANFDSPLWIIYLHRVHLIGTRSRALLFLLNMYKFLCAVNILYSGPQAWMILSFIFIMPYALVQSLAAIIALGKFMDVHDEDFVNLWRYMTSCCSSSDAATRATPTPISTSASLQPQRQDQEEEGRGVRGGAAGGAVERATDNSKSSSFSPKREVETHKANTSSSAKISNLNELSQVDTAISVMDVSRNDDAENTVASSSVASFFTSAYSVTVGVTVDSTISVGGLVAGIFSGGGDDNGRTGSETSANRSEA